MHPSLVSTKKNLGMVETSPAAYQISEASRGRVQALRFSNVLLASAGIFEWGAL